MANPVPIVRAAPRDAAGILALQRLAYRSEAELYGDWGIAPLRETLAEVEHACAAGVVLKAMAGGVIVGSVRGAPSGDTCRVGRLSVHPAHRRRGIGTRLLSAVEEAFPRARVFELFTGHRSADNLRLYGRLGYRRVRDEAVSGALTLVFLRKMR